MNRHVTKEKIKMSNKHKQISTTKLMEIKKTLLKERDTIFHLKTEKKKSHLVLECREDAFTYYR